MGTLTGSEYEGVVQRLASLCPVGAFADSFEARFSSLLASARIYLSPRTYSRFSVSLMVYPIVGEVLALALLPGTEALFVLCSLALLQTLPLLIPLVMSGTRRKSVEAELPFFLIALSIFSRDESPSVDEGLRRVAALGDNVFPALRSESEMLERDLTFLPGSPVDVLESAFRNHPSRSLKDFVHSFTITLSTGKSVRDYIDEESRRQVGLLESKWRAFSESVASLAEVSLMVLALFPVGVEMIASAIPGFTSSVMLLLSTAVLVAFTGALLMVLESVQPVTHNAAPRAVYLVLTLSTWTACTVLYLQGLVPLSLSLALPLCLSVLGFLQTRTTYDRIRRGEDEVSILLHDLAQESKAGVNLPEALSKVTSAEGYFQSIGEPLAAFHRSIMLGATPAEAQKGISHPSWLVRLSFGLLSVAFATGAGFEELERLSSFFKKIADARKNASRSLLPFVIVGVIVPVISVAAMNFLGGFSAGSDIPFLPNFSGVSQTYVLVSISAVSLLTGLTLSKLFTLTARHAVAIPVLLASTLVSLVVFGLL